MSQAKLSSNAPLRLNRCGGFTPQANEYLMKRAQASGSAQSVANIVRPPRQWPKKADGLSSHLVISGSRLSTKVSKLSTAVSLIRVPRPGGSTTTISTEGSSNCGQARNDTRPPPANGKQNRRALAFGLGRGAISHFPTAHTATSPAERDTGVSKSPVPTPLPPLAGGLPAFLPTFGRPLPAISLAATLSV